MKNALATLAMAVASSPARTVVHLMGILILNELRYPV